MPHRVEPFRPVRHDEDGKQVGRRGDELSASDLDND